MSRREEADGAAPNLLHNSAGGCAPRRVNHNVPEKQRRAAGRGRVFQLSPDFGDTAPAALFERLEGAAPGQSPAALRQLLVARFDAHAPLLELPQAAPVLDAREARDEECEDLLSILTVLSKSSDKVYLRAKAPNLDRIAAGRRVVLLVPRAEEHGK